MRGSIDSCAKRPVGTPVEAGEALTRNGVEVIVV
jgi:hypothetical protein